MALPTIMTSTGLQPIAPSTIRDMLLTDVATTNPGFTANLPGSLIDDVTGTDIAAIALCDQARVELINSITPMGANVFILNQLGVQMGIIRGAATNSNASCTFTGTPGFIIVDGFVVSDGSHQYKVSSGGIIPSTGAVTLFCVALVYGQWNIPANSITQLITALPSGIIVTVTNSLPGTPSSSPESDENYRARILQAGLAPSIGAIDYLKTQLQRVPGVLPRLVSVQVVGDAFKVLVGGGAPSDVAYAIYKGLFDIGDLAGSILSVSGITAAATAVITCNQYHGFSTGQTVGFTGIVGTMGSVLNNVPGLIATKIDLKTFSVPINTTGLTYTSGGTITPNVRNNIATINSYPDQYQIIFVQPQQQILSVSIGWKTTLNTTINAAVSQLAQPAIRNYINSLPIGYSINVYELQTIFLESIAAILPAHFISVIGDANGIALTSNSSTAFAIDGVVVNPAANTGLITGDPEGYFYSDLANIVITRLS